MRTVEVLVDAVAGQVPLLRSVAADVAIRNDFDLDAIEDLRMAVDEAAALLVGCAVDGRAHALPNCAPSSNACSSAWPWTRSVRPNFPAIPWAGRYFPRSPPKCVRMCSERSTGTG